MAVGFLVGCWCGEPAQDIDGQYVITQKRSSHRITVRDQAGLAGQQVGL